MGGKGGTSTQTIKESADPWVGIQPYLIGGSVTTPTGGFTTQPITMWYNPATGAYSQTAPTTTNITTNPFLPYLGNRPVIDEEGYQWIPISQTAQIPTVSVQPITGIYPEAMRIYQQSLTNLQNITPLIDEYKNLMLTNLEDYQKSMLHLQDVASGLIGSATDFTSKLPYVSTTFLPVTVSAPQIKPVTVSAPQVDFLKALKKLGELDPSEVFKELMKGDINPFLQQAEQAIIQNITRNTLENVLPNITSQAFATGAYGGSRQGIAEGLALSRLQQDIAQPMAELRYNVWNVAQQLKANISQYLANQAMMESLENAKLKLEADIQTAILTQDANKFNAGLEMQAQIVNAQNALAQRQMQLQAEITNLDAYLRGSQLGLQQTLAGAQLLPTTMQNLSSYYSTLLGLETLPNELMWQNMMRYASIIQPGAGIGGATTRTTEIPYYTNPIAGGLGGALTGLSLATALGAETPGLFAGLGGLLGLLSDKKLKHNIIDLGNGLYAFKYYDSKRWNVGVMADEMPTEMVYEYKGIKYIVRR